MIQTVHPCPHIDADRDCPRCGGDGFYLVELSPDPLRAPGTDGYYQQPVAPRRDPDLSLVAILLVIGTLLLITWLVSARPGSVAVPEPPPQPGAGGAAATLPGAPMAPVGFATEPTVGLSSPTSAPHIIPAAGASFLLAGKATHYPACDRCAAAGPDLRALLGPGYLGKTVRVTLAGGSRHVDVVLVTSCACGDRGGSPTIIDLSLDSFEVLAPLGSGVIDVEVEPATRTRIALPPTDTVR